MKKIDWLKFYSYHNIADRRNYLQELFKNDEKHLNRLLFNVKPVDKKENENKKFPKLRNLSQRSANFGRSLLRHIILPFPLVWTSKSSETLLTKSVVSMEAYMMSAQQFRLKDHISALRTGAPQYRGLLYGGAASLISLAAAVSVASFGIVPAVLLGAGAAYFAYTAYRASRKISKQVGFLKSRIASLDKYVPHSKSEKLLNRMYNLVTVLENVKEEINKKSNSDKPALDHLNFIRNTLKEQLATSLNEDNFTKDFLSIVKEPVKDFLDTNFTNPLGIEQINAAIETLLHKFQTMDMYHECELQDLVRRVEKHIPKVIEELKKTKGNTKFRQISELAKIKMEGEKSRWNKEQYVEALQATSLPNQIKTLLISKLGKPIIDFDTPINFEQSAGIRQSGNSQSSQRSITTGQIQLREPKNSDNGFKPGRRIAI